MEKELKSLNILHLAFCTGTTLTMVLLHFLIRPIDFKNYMDPLDKASLIALTIFTIVIFGVLLMTKIPLLEKKDRQEVLADKRSKYIIRWAILEGSALALAMIYFFMNGHPLVIMLGIVALFLLVASKASKK